jgi:hypothetical protein
LSFDFEFLKCGLVDDEGVSVKNGVGVVVVCVDVVLEPVVVNPSARLLNAVGFHLHNRV